MATDLATILGRIDRSVEIVRGYHRVTDPPEEALRHGLGHRVAFILDSHRRDRVDIFFDAELYFELVAGAANYLQAARVEVIEAEGSASMDLEEARAKTLSLSEVDREPPRRILIKNGENLLAGVIDAESWALVGGPEPYSDSYTLSLYTGDDQFEGLVLMCDAVCQKLGATLAGVYEGEAQSTQMPA